MPFCVQCGNQVGASDAFCARCGQRQAAAAASGGNANPVDGMSPRTASLLCYVPLLGWLMSLIVLASTRLRQNPTVRFHAFQSLYLFVAWLVLDWVVKPIFHMGGISRIQRVVPDILQLAIFIGWIVMLIKVSQNERYHLPILGDLAERSVAEQA